MQCSFVTGLCLSSWLFISFLNPWRAAVHTPELLSDPVHLNFFHEANLLSLKPVWKTSLPVDRSLPAWGCESPGFRHPVPKHRICVEVLWRI